MKSASTLAKIHSRAGKRHMTNPTSLFRTLPCIIGTCSEGSSTKPLEYELIFGYGGDDPI
jgi:hypothetical protein